MNGGEQRHIIAIDLLRFACAMAVLAYHFWMVFPLATSSATYMFGLSNPLATGAAPWTASGWVGVEIFFVISGYVIALSAEHADRATFARGRILRLVPAGLICAVLTALVLVLSGALPATEAATRLITTITMLPFGPRIDGAWWTLQVETSFYLAVACVLRADHSNGRRLQLLGIGLTMWSLLFYIQALARGHVPDMIGSIATLVLLSHGMFFALGIALRSIETRGWGKGRAIAVAAALAVSLIEVVATGFRHDGAGGIRQSAAIPAALFLAGVFVIARAPRWTMSGRPARVLRRVGALTYPLYLVNQVIGAATVAGLVAIGCPASAALILGACAMLALAALISLSLEPHVRGGISALLDGSMKPQRSRFAQLARPRALPLQSNFDRPLLQHPHPQAESQSKHVLSRGDDSS